MSEILRSGGEAFLLAGKSDRLGSTQAIPLVLEGDFDEYNLSPGRSDSVRLRSPELGRLEGAGSNVRIWECQLFRAGSQLYFSSARKRSNRFSRLQR
jgi:hypothetical protein